MDLEQIYKDCGAYLQGHFLLSSGKHSEFYLQSAKVLENPKLAARLCDELAKIIAEFNIEFDSICSPALGGILAGYELARACDKRFIFTERVNGEMTLNDLKNIHFRKLLFSFFALDSTLHAFMRFKKLIFLACSLCCFSESGA